MAAEPRTWTKLALEARHIEDPHDPDAPNPHDVANPVTGFVDIGAVVDGVFVILARRKASGLFADIERAKSSSGDSASPSE